MKWTNDIGKQYDGRIFSFKLRCHGDEGNVSNSCLFFKKNGSRKYDALHISNVAELHSYQLIGNSF